MNRMLLALLGTYKKIVSPLLPAGCRFVPTCSEYAMEAIARHGALTGCLLAMWRLARCNPFSWGGLDQVPTQPIKILIHQHFEHEHDAACHKSTRTPAKAVHTVGIIDRI